MRSTHASLAAVMTWAATVVIVAAQSSQPFLPRELNEWTLEYTLSGGMAFRIHSVSLTSSGALAAGDSALGHRISARASDDTVAKVRGLLTLATRPKPSGRPIPDVPMTALVVKTGGKSYDIAAPSDLFKTLDDAFNAAVAQALIGEWRQSAWKLCKPVAQLGPADIDPAIESLIFQEDGTLSVTWPGGPRTTGVPHADVADYAGHYSVRPENGVIRMRIDGGRFVPGDFDGEGTFALADGTLTIRDAWFGTKQAKHKPDICELTFVRK